MPEDSLITKGPEVADVNRSIWKTWVTVIVPAFVAFGASYLFINGNLLWCGILAVIFLSLLALQAFFLKEFGYIALALFLETAALVAPYYHTSFSYLILSAAIIFVCFLGGVLSGRRELENALKVPFSRVARKALVGGATGVLLGMTILSAVVGGGSSFSYGDLVKTVLDPMITPVMRYYAPDYTPDMTVRGVLIQVVRRAQPAIDKLPKSAGSKVLNDAVNAASVQLKSSLGVDLNLDSTVSANVTDLFVKKVGVMSLPIKFAIYAILFLLLWAAIHFVAAVLSYPLLVVTFILFEIFIAAGFAVIQLESRSREIVLLS